MEDADLAVNGHITLNHVDHPFALFGVFDGHGGADASDFVKKHLQDYLCAELSNQLQGGINEEAIFKALKVCFKNLQTDYPGVDDGTTAVIAFFFEEKIWIANVGDSRALFVNTDQQGKATQASEDAKPTVDRYRKKIEKKGGVVILGRVMGSLSVACAIGDKNLDPYLPHHPKISCYNLNEAPEYLVLCCDGLTDVASTNEIGSALMTLHEKGNNPTLMAKSLVFHAVGVSQSRDNVTVMVIKR